MYLVYIDESGNTGVNLSDTQQPVFVLCAVIVHKDDWISLEAELQQAIDNFFPDQPPENFEAHATDIRNGKGFFKGFDIAHRLAFRDRWFDIAASHDLKVVYRAIVKKRFQRWVRSTFGSGVAINPHVVAFPLLAQVINEYLAALPDPPLGILISDENAEIVRDVEKSIKILRGIDNSLRLNRIIEKGFFINSKASLPLQLCDLCAYTARKKEEAKVGMPLKSTDDGAIQKMDPLVHRGNELLWDVLNWLAKQQ